MGDCFVFFFFFLTWLIIMVEVKFVTEVMKVILPYNKLSINLYSLKHRTTGLDPFLCVPFTLSVTWFYVLRHYLYKETFYGKGRNFFFQKMLILLTWWTSGQCMFFFQYMLFEWSIFLLCVSSTPCPAPVINL